MQYVTSESRQSGSQQPRGSKNTTEAPAIKRCSLANQGKREKQREGKKVPIKM